MTDLFGASLGGQTLPEIINDALGGDMLDATLYKQTIGTRTPGALTAGTNPTFTPHASKGFIEEYTDREIVGTQIQRSQRKITLLGASIAGGAIPEPGDKILIEAATWLIVDNGVMRDPAKATYECQSAKTTPVP